MAYALDIGDPNINPVAKYTNLGVFVNLFIPLVTFGALIFFLAMLLYGAFTWATAGDSPDNVVKAQKTIIFAIVGLLIIVFAYAIVKILGFILHINIL